MLRFERMKKLERILIAAGVILLIIAVSSLFRGLQPISSRETAEAQVILFLMIGSTLSAVIAFLSALMLHVIRKDVEEELK